MAFQDTLEKRAEKMFQSVFGWEQKALIRIGKRVKSIGSLSFADLQAINNYAQYRGMEQEDFFKKYAADLAKIDANEVMADLAKLTGQNVRETKQIYADTINAQHEENKALYDYRNKPYVPLTENKQLQSLVDAYSRTTAETFVNFSMTKAQQIGFMKNGKFIPLQKSFTDVLDKAVVSIATGTGTFGAEMRDVLRELGGSGVRVDYGNGVTRSLDSMVRQNLLWGAKQASREYSRLIREELGCDGIEIDWHTNPRPSHEFMQGKQFVLGKARTINGIYFESADDALKALDDYGCLHFESPIICGVSEPAYTPEELERLNRENAQPIEIDGVTKTGYEWKQTMRRLERAGRQAKLQREVLKVSGDNIGAEQAEKTLKAIRKREKRIMDKYEKIADRTGSKAQPEKMSFVNGEISNGKSRHYIKGNIVKAKSGDGSSPLTKQLAKELTEQTNIFEKKIGALDEITAIKPMRYDNDGVWGGYNDNSGIVFLYGIGGKSGKSTMTNIAKEMHKQGKWSTPSPYHVLYHELGHSWLQQQKRMEGYSEKILEISKIKDNLLLELTKDTNSDKLIMKRALSTYGLSSKAEIDDFICECIAEYVNGKPRVTAQNVVKILLRE